MINIEELTLKQIRELQDLVGNNAKSTDSHPWRVGKHYLIRTVTMIQYGKLVAVYPQELVLEEAAWIADTGRFSEALEDMNNCSEVEPFNAPVVIGRGSIVDAQVVKPFTVSKK